jgi:ATP-dependent Lon protease
VRNLKKHLEKIYRKVALKLVEADHVAETADKGAPTGDAGRIELYSNQAFYCISMARVQIPV